MTIRKARHDAKDFVSALVGDKEVGKDEGERAQKSIEDVVQKGTTEVDNIVERKEKDILEV